MKVEEMSTIDLIRDVREKRPATQEDMTALLYYVWKRRGAELPTLREFRKLPNPNTVLREGRRLK